MKVYTQREVVEELRYLADSMSTHKALAEKIGITPANLHDVLTNRRNPGYKILKFLKYEKVVCYKDIK